MRGHQRTSSLLLVIIGIAIVSLACSTFLDGNTSIPTSTSTSTPNRLTTSTPEPTLTPQTQLTIATVEPVSEGTAVPIADTPITPENAHLVQELARWGDGFVTSVAHSPAGDLVAIGTSIGVYIRDAGDLSLVKLIDTTESVADVIFSPRGDTLIIVSFKGRISEWQVSDGTLRRILREPYPEKALYCSLAVSPDGGLLAVSGYPDIGLWRLEDGQMIASVQDDAIWDVADLAFSPDGTTLASAITETVRTWQIPDLTPASRLVGHTGDVTSIAYSPDGTLLATGAKDSSVRLWRVSDGSLLHTLPEEMGEEYGVFVDFLPDANRLVSLALPYDAYPQLSLWNAQNGDLLHTATAETDSFATMSVSSNGLLVIGSLYGSVHTYRVSDFAVVASVEASIGWQSRVAVSSDSSVVATAGEDMLHLRRTSDGEEFFGWVIDNWGSYTIAFSPDGKYLALTADDWVVELVDIEEGRTVHHLVGHSDPIEFVEISQDGALIVSGGRDGTVRLWNTDSGALVDIYNLNEPESDFPAQIKSAALSPDNSLLAVGTDQEIRIFSVSTGEVIQTIEEQSGYDLTFSPDGHTLASGGWDPMVHLWNVENGSLEAEFEGQWLYVHYVQYSSDGSILLSASDNGYIVLWDTEAKQILKVIDLPNGLRSVALSEDGRTIVAGSDDGTVRLFGLPAR